MTARDGGAAAPAGAPSTARSTVPVVVPVHIRFEDVTPAWHVGNAAILSLIEEARNRLLWYGGRAPGGVAVPGLFDAMAPGRAFLVASQTIEYPTEMFYSPEPVEVGFWVGHIGRSSFTLDAQIRPSPDGPPAVRTESVVVVTDRASGRPAPIGDGLRADLHRILAEPVPLRPRPGAGARDGDRAADRAAPAAAR